MSAPNNPVWYISRDGQRIGPLTADEFARFEEGGRLRPTDQVWQTGMSAWIAYSDYDVRKAAARFVSPARSSTPASTGSQRAITNTLKGAIRGISNQLAKIRTISARSPDPDASPAPTPNDAAAATARPTADPHPMSIRPQLFGAKEANVLRLSIAPVLEQRDVVIEHESKQDTDSVSSDPTIDIVAVPLGPSVSPRLLSEAQAAAQVGLELPTFRAWVADGRLPRALPDCGKYDMKAIHLALDRLSGIARRESGSNDLLQRPARRKT